MYHSQIDEQATAQSARFANAQAEHNAYIQEQGNALALEPINLKTPQRKARYHDPCRIRWKSARSLALSATNCKDTADVKRWLKRLVARLDLRLTSAWIAIRRDLATHIKALRNRVQYASVDAQKARSDINYVPYARGEKQTAANWGACQTSILGQQINNYAPERVAAALSSQKTWADVQKLIGRIAVAVKTDATSVFVAAVKHIALVERQNLVQLLANHIRQYPKDALAYNWIPRCCRQLVEKAQALQAQAPA